MGHLKTWDCHQFAIAGPGPEGCATNRITFESSTLQPILSQRRRRDDSEESRPRSNASNSYAASSSSRSVESRALNVEMESASLRTTVILRNLPAEYTRSMVQQTLDKHGYFGLYDFLY